MGKFIYFLLILCCYGWSLGNLFDAENITEIEEENESDSGILASIWDSIPKNNLYEAARGYIFSEKQGWH